MGTYELRGQGKKKKKKKEPRIIDKNLLPPKKNYLQKNVLPPLNIRKSTLRGARTKKSTFLKNSHPRTGPMSFAAKGKKKKKSQKKPKKTPPPQKKKKKKKKKS